MPRENETIMGTGRLATIHFCLLFSGFSNDYHSACVWPTALKLGCVTSFDMLFPVMGLISVVNKIQFMLISSQHICIRSMETQQLKDQLHKNLAFFVLPL